VNIPVALILAFIAAIEKFAINICIRLEVNDYHERRERKGRTR